MVAAAGAAHVTRAHATLEQGRALLLAGQGERAAVVFAGLRGAPWLSARTEAGGRLSLALLGHDPGGEVSVDARVYFGASHLLEVAARNAPLTGQRALAALLDRSAERLAALPLAAFDLDDGRDEDARRRVASDPSAFEGRGLGREVIAVLRLREAGARTIVRDRAGRRLGHLADDGGLWLAEGVDAALVPEAVRAALPTAAAAPGLRLSLDLALSRLALEALGQARGSVVLLDPRTGGVLAAVSDALTLARTGGTPAFEERREPASVAKVITTAAALRAGIDPDAFIRRLDCRGPERFGKGILWCSYPAGPLLGLDQAMAVSCNMAFAHLGVAAGRAALVDEFHRWGFDHDFTAAPAGRVVQPAGDERQLADLAIGLEATDITPLHGALLGAVLADGGRMPEPVVLEAEEGPMGLEPRPMPRPPARDVLDPSMIPVLARAMLAVATRGTAAGTTSLDFPVAMKTGTGAERRHGYHANYVGVAPWPDPVVAFSVRITYEPTSSRVNQTARVVLIHLLDGLRRRYRLRARTSEAPHTAGL
jgi:hypothetical protein